MMVCAGGEHKRVRRVPAQLRTRDGRGAAPLRVVAEFRRAHARHRLPRPARLARRPAAQARRQGAEECPRLTCTLTYMLVSYKLSFNTGMAFLFCAGEMPIYMNLLTGLGPGTVRVSRP